MPRISLCLPGTVRAPFSSPAKRLYSTSLMSDDLPEPETPVMHTSLPSGMSTVTFFRLFCCAPTMVIFLPFPSRLVCGTGMNRCPLKYWPVMDSGHFKIPCTSPL